MARALSNSFNFGLLGEQSFPKCEIPCPGRRLTTVQNLTHLALSSAEKSSNVQTNKQTHTHTQISLLVSQIDIRDIPVLLSIHVESVESARDLGVIVDSQLSLSAHVTALCRSCYYHLRQLRPAARSLSTETAKTLVQAFISCRLDYCNSLMYGVADSLIRRAQLVQNAAARLITAEKRQEHITPVLRQLHWLPVRQRVQFKLACIMYKSLHGQASSTWPMMSSFSLIADGVSFDQPTTEHALSHEHRTVSATETFLLPDPESGTICHRNCDT